MYVWFREPQILLDLIQFYMRIVLTLILFYQAEITFQFYAA